MKDIEVLKEIIASGESFILNGVKKILTRENISFPSALKKVCILYGVRRSGKSYILFDLFKKHKDTALYIDFEDERLENFQAEDFNKLKEAFFEMKPHLINSKKIFFLFDEIQNIHGWEKFSRRMVEKEDINVFATGSSSKIMQIHTSLRGRSWSIEVLPFSFREYAQLKDIDIKDKKIIYGHKKALVKNCFSEYLKWGGFPEISYLESEYDKKKVLKEYLEAMFFRDLVERFNITNIHLLDGLNDTLLSSFSLKYSLASFYKQNKNKFPFSKDSLYAYFQHFIESMLIFEVKMLSESSYQRLRNPVKIYAADTGLAKKVTSSDFGRLLENIVYLELRRKGLEVYYFQSPEGKNECDFAAKEGEMWHAYQVTWRMDVNNKEREINGLISACKSLNLKSGTILTYDEEGEEKINNIIITIKPVWKWLLM